MIHFRCRCGRTISVAEDDGGGRTDCPDCGVQLRIPLSAGVAADTGESRAASLHDFDAEIVQAARRKPQRALKTPPRITPTGDRPSPAESGSADGGTAPRRPGAPAGVLAAAALLLFLGSAGVVAAMAPIDLWLRIAAALALAGFGLSVYVLARLLARIAKRLSAD